MTSRHLAARASRRCFLQWLRRAGAGGAGLVGPWRAAALAGLLGLGMVPPAQALQLRLAGLMGDKALLVINGQARVLSAGAEADGVRVLRVSADGVDVEVAGRRDHLSLHGGPAALSVLGAAGDAGVDGSPIVLRPGPDGVFALDAQVQGQSLKGVIDTGATLVAVPGRLARSLGLVASGQDKDIVLLQTANGRAQGWRVNIAQIKVGATVVRDVEAVVVEGDLPRVLWGNSLLKAFRVQLQGGQMTLTPASAGATLARLP